VSSQDDLPDQLLQRVQSLSEELDQLPESRARELAEELVEAVVAMYGDGLSRIVETIERAREAGATILDELAQDGAVASLLLIHDLYPVPLYERVLEALDVEDGVARLALRGSCNGCAASQATLELAIKQALEEHAPDLAGLEVGGVVPEPDRRLSGAFELPVLHAAPGPCLP